MITPLAVEPVTDTMLEAVVLLGVVPLVAVEPVYSAIRVCMLTLSP